MEKIDNFSFPIWGQLKIAEFISMSIQNWKRFGDLYSKNQLFELFDISVVWFEVIQKCWIEIWSSELNGRESAVIRALDGSTHL